MPNIYNLDKSLLEENWSSYFLLKGYEKSTIYASLPLAFDIPKGKK